MQDFGHHFGAWLIIIGVAIPFIGAFLYGPPVTTTPEILVWNFLAIFGVSFGCAVVDYFAIPRIVRLFKSLLGRR
jgi:hypothetical protein